MAPLVAPDIARFAITGYCEANPVVNIIDLAITDLDGIGRAEACEAAAGDILNQWSDHVLPLLCDNYVATNVSWIDLDSLSGSTGDVSTTDGSTWPEGGASVEACLPGGIAARVDKNTVAVRGQRQGRMYICGIPENASEANSPNTLTGAFRTSLQDAMEAFRSGLEGSENVEPLPGGYTSSPNVVHTIDGVYESRSRITAMSVSPLLRTQVRRMRS